MGTVRPWTAAFGTADPIQMAEYAVTRRNMDTYGYLRHLLSQVGNSWQEEREDGYVSQKLANRELLALDYWPVAEYSGGSRPSLELFLRSRCMEYCME